jgi:hypothetical protein
MLITPLYQLHALHNISGRPRAAILSEYMRMSIHQPDKAAMAQFHAAHLDHVEVESEFYAELAAQQAVATTTTGAASSVVGAGPL